MICPHCGAGSMLPVTAKACAGCGEVDVEAMNPPPAGDPRWREHFSGVLYQLMDPTELIAELGLGERLLVEDLTGLIVEACAIYGVDADGPELYAVLAGAAMLDQLEKGGLGIGHVALGLRPRILANVPPADDAHP